MNDDQFSRASGFLWGHFSVQPFIRYISVGKLKTVFLTPRRIGSLRPLIQLVVGVLKHKANVKMGMLPLNQQVFLTVRRRESPLYFKGDPVG